MSELQKVETAIYAFRDKYSGLPGDLSNATSFFGTTDAEGLTIANGNGDGTILSSISAYTSGDCMTAPATQFRYGAVPNEVQEVFHHLNLAGMGNYNVMPPALYASTNEASLPNSVLGGGMLVTCLQQTPGPTGTFNTTFSSGTGIVIGGVQDGTYYSTRLAYVEGYAGDAPLLSISPDMASRLDAKIDDGLPLTGNVGVLMSCNGGSGWALPPSIYAAMVSTCDVSVVKVLWH